MTEHAYRASDEFATALRAKSVDENRFRDEVIIPWDEAHPDTKTLWSRSPFSTRRDCIGFTDPGGEKPPAGLSRRRGRKQLIPLKSKAGEPWREHKDRVNAGPSVADAFREFEVPDHVLGPGRLYTVGLLPDGDGPSDPVYITSGYPLEGREDDESSFRSRTPLTPHLTPIPLSEFYAVKERLDAERDAGQAVAS